MKDIVFVKGNIIGKSGNHQAKELIAWAGDDWEKIADKIINGDLTLSTNDILKPYKIYCAAKEITDFGNSLSGMLSPADVFRIFNEEINNLNRLKNIDLSSELVDVLKRQIYIGVVSTMELFLCDFFYSMVLGNKDYYNRFCENTSQIIKLKENSASEKEILNAVTKKILKTNYHRIESVNEIYKNILGIELPSYERFKKQIFTRHSLVHRNGFPTNKSKYIKVDNNMIDELISEVQAIVNYIIEEKESELENWFPDITKQ